MSTIIESFQLLEKEVNENYCPTRIRLMTFPSKSCVLDVVISDVLTVFEYSERLKQFGIYSGKSVDLFNAETKVFEQNEFEQAKNFYIKRLNSLEI
jgi:hypothetical protein